MSRIHNSLDVKINQIRSKIAQHISVSKNRYTEFLREFQRSFITTILQPVQDTHPRAYIETAENIESAELIHIFRQLGIKNEVEFANTVMQNIAGAITGLRESSTEDGGLYGSFSHFTSLSIALRIASLIPSYKDLEEKRAEIFQRSELLQSSTNYLLQGKEIQIGDNNYIFVSSPDGTIDVKSLSSGEKQILILLGECLVGGAEGSIYLADKPEISLNLKWQRQVFAILKELSPSTQLIFASHSPEIVDRRRGHVEVLRWMG